jgi:hypothetical protein
LVARVAFVVFWLVYVGGPARGAVRADVSGPGKAPPRARLSLRRGIVRPFELRRLAVPHLCPATDFKCVARVFRHRGLSTYALALGSVRQLRDVMRTSFWPIFSTIAIEYIAFLFFRDFVLLPLQEGIGLPLNIFSSRPRLRWERCYAWRRRCSVGAYVRRSPRLLLRPLQLPPAAHHAVPQPFRSIEPAREQFHGNEFGCTRQKSKTTISHSLHHRVA